MIYEIEDKKVKRLLEKKEIFFKEVNEVNKQIVELDKKRKKLVYRAQRVKEKVMPLMKKYYLDGTIKINPPISIPTRISLVKGIIEVEVSNLVDEYEKMLIEKHEEAKKSKK